MAIPPTIPTSFVPKQPVATSPKRRTSGANPFLALAYLITGIVVVGAFAVFGFQLYLEKVAQKKANEVLAAQTAIDKATVTEFIRLRDRFIEAKHILDNHVTLSRFFDDLEKVTLVGVRFTSASVEVKDDRSATINMNGSARTFNTLAAQSAEIASDKRIKRAIFSSIASDPKNGTVSFDLSAELDPSLVVVSTLVEQPAVVTPTPQVPPPASTTPSAPVETASTTP